MSSLLDMLSCFHITHIVSYSCSNADTKLCGEKDEEKLDNFDVDVNSEEGKDSLGSSSMGDVSEGSNQY